jgi:hypothetical protein
MRLRPRVREGEVQMRLEGDPHSPRPRAEHRSAAALGSRLCWRTRSARWSSQRSTRGVRGSQQRRTQPAPMRGEVESPCQDQAAALRSYGESNLNASQAPARGRSYSRLCTSGTSRIDRLNAVFRAGRVHGAQTGLPTLGSSERALLHGRSDRPEHFRGHR